MSLAGPSRGGRRPTALLLLAAVLGAEAIGLAVIALLAVGASSSSDRVTSGIAVAIFILIIAVLLALVAVGTFRARPWTRSAALVWQLVQALVGAYSLQGAGAAVGFGVAAIGLALAGLVLLFSRSVREATNRV